MFSLLVKTDTVRKTAGRPQGSGNDAIWAEADAFFGHGHQAQAKGFASAHIAPMSLHSGAYGRFSLWKGIPYCTNTFINAASALWSYSNVTSSLS